MTELRTTSTADRPRSRDERSRPQRHVSRRHPGRWVAAAGCALVVAAVISTLLSNPRYQWGVVADYMLHPRILAGLWLTLWLTSLCMVLGSAIGTFLAIGHMSENVVVRLVIKGYIWLFRGVPVLVQLILLYNLAALYPRISLALPFGGPVLLSAETNALVTPLMAAIVGLSLHLSAYMAEIVRGGILSVGQGQIEAAESIGMTNLMSMRRIILPQALPVIIPTAANQLIALLKYSSLVSVLAVADLLFSAQLIYQVNYQVIPLLIVVSIWYLVAVSGLSLGVRYLEQRFG